MQRGGTALASAVLVLLCANASLVDPRANLAGHPSSRQRRSSLDDAAFMHGADRRMEALPVKDGRRPCADSSPRSFEAAAASF